MSFLKSLFGGRSAPAETPQGEPVEYKGYVIRPAPFQNGGQYQTAGTIEKNIDGVRKEHRFIRADSHASLDDAKTFSLSKARQIVDLQGDRMFD
ncbi:MAG: hypothetical protein HXX10_05595 [Rhodoplanes sp.]|uniref:HlyU family transcriptional regulator n=1 Tax=Rhodoplanes sp. TaxID=1968906 RepID=UPI0017CFC293|nr:HlyU family transcriptional regulator [Rhodoplanes sp.]NVO13494.1 hypothetical protein [Rhodoplanes sp.]